MLHRRTTPVLPLSGLLMAGMLVTGCYKTASSDPFAREEPEVRLEGLAAVSAGAVGQFGLGLSDIASKLSGNSPRYLEYARTLANPDARPDELREAVLGMPRYQHGRKPPYTDAYAQLAQRSPHALVRASAIRALNISRYAPAVPVFVEALNDQDAAVRLEAAKALANVPGERAAAALLAVASNREEDLDIRLAAIDALRHYEEVETRRGLVRLLESEDFSVAWQARRSLITSTGHDHGFDVAAWRQAVG